MVITDELCREVANVLFAGPGTRRRVSSAVTDPRAPGLPPAEVVPPSGGWLARRGNRISGYPQARIQAPIQRRSVPDNGTGITWRKIRCSIEWRRRRAARTAARWLIAPALTLIFLVIEPSGPRVVLNGRSATDVQPFSIVQFRIGHLGRIGGTCRLWSVVIDSKSAVGAKPVQSRYRWSMNA